jgi:hypothetical protein
VVGRGRLPELVLQPGGTRRVALSLNVDAVDIKGSSRGRGDYWLDLSWNLKHDEPWARAGHCIAWEQFVATCCDDDVAPAKAEADEAMVATALVDRETDDELVVTNPTAGWTLTFDKRDGRVSYSTTTVRRVCVVCVCVCGACAVARCVCVRCVCRLTVNAVRAVARAAPQFVASADRQRSLPGARPGCVRTH